MSHANWTHAKEIRHHPSKNCCLEPHSTAPSVHLASPVHQHIPLLRTETRKNSSFACYVPITFQTSLDCEASSLLSLTATAAPTVVLPVALFRPAHLHKLLSVSQDSRSSHCTAHEKTISPLRTYFHDVDFLLACRNVCYSAPTLLALLLPIGAHVLTRSQRGAFLPPAHHQCSWDPPNNSTCLNNTTLHQLMAEVWVAQRMHYQPQVMC